jgi:hypothetical protein
MVNLNNKLLLLVLLLALTECCLITDLIVEKTTTTKTTRFIATTTEATTTTTTSTSTTMTTTTTTSTSTTNTIVPLPSTIANARCYMSSDCGSSSVSYYCKKELIEGIQQPTVRGDVVYKVTYIPICRNPGTALAKCETIRRERSWDMCLEWEHCINGCHTCVPIGVGKCPQNEE